MLPGPVFNVELLTSSRRRWTFGVRVVYGLILLFIIWMSYRESFPERAMAAGTVSIQRLSQFAAEIFAVFAVTQAVAVALLTPPLIAGVIADDRQRKTLHYLLASRLTSGEIVLGKLAAKLLHLGLPGDRPADPQPADPLRRARPAARRPQLPRDGQHVALPGEPRGGRLGGLEEGPRRDRRDLSARPDLGLLPAADRGRLQAHGRPGSTRRSGRSTTGSSRRRRSTWSSPARPRGSGSPSPGWSASSSGSQPC